MISDNRLQQALTYLATTDEPCAMAKAHADALREQLKTIEAMEYLKADGAVKEREAHARSSVDYKNQTALIEDATAEYETMRLKRATEALIVEVWRTEAANRRAGNIS